MYYPIELYATVCNGLCYYFNNYPVELSLSSPVLPYAALCYPTYYSIYYPIVPYATFIHPMYYPIEGYATLSTPALSH